jgi:hypothetical protein
MIYLIGDIAEFNKNNNLKRNLMIGAGLLGGVALTTIGVRSYLRNGKLVRQSTRKINKVNDVVNPSVIKTASDVLANHKSTLHLIVEVNKVKDLTVNGVLDKSRLNKLLDEATYFKSRDVNYKQPIPDITNESINDLNDVREVYLEIANTAINKDTPVRYMIKGNMTDNDKGFILNMKPVKYLSTKNLDNFNRI